MKIAVDVGGTFTDIVAVSDGEVFVGKTPTTPKNISQGFLKAVKMATNSFQDVDEIVHGTTVVLNSLLVGQGPQTALITTKGFRDVLEIMRADRKDLFDLSQTKPKPLIPRDRCLELDERISASGEIIFPLESSEINAIITKLKQLKIESVAICLLFSFLDPSHEILVGKAIANEIPGISISLSHEVLPLYREYERTSTTVVNASAQPIMKHYISEVVPKLQSQSFQGDFYVMQSNGGLASPNETIDRPVYSLFSGPAGGVIAAAEFGRRHGFSNLLSLDMGGTSTDVAAVTDAKPDLTIGIEIGGYPISIPSLDIISVGAGGGSIASVDPGGGLEVGPKSSGAMPGPACYGNAGTDATVTDAAVTIGRYNGDIPLGGTIKIQKDLAEKSIEDISKKLKMKTHETAWGIISLVNANMANAVREVSVERGRDPRDYILFASGGGGPAHGWDVAKELGIKKVLIPPFPGAASAHGMLVSEIRIDSIRTVHRPLLDLTVKFLKTLFLELSDEAYNRLPETVRKEQIKYSYKLDLRYKGQTYELGVPVHIDDIQVKAIANLFHELHNNRYGHAFPEGPIELVHARASSIAPRKVIPKTLPQWITKYRTESRPVFWGPKEGWIKTPTLSREEMQKSEKLEGPAIVQQNDSTIVIPPKACASVLNDGCIILECVKNKAAEPIL